MTDQQPANMGEERGAESFSELKRVTETQLGERLAEVKVLAEDEYECYRLVRDIYTGEHYLHFAVRHLNVAGGGAEEHYHHIMPLDSDDVIAAVLGEPWPVYPEGWTSAYLRNGPNGDYVWYNPNGASQGTVDYEEAAAAIRSKLLALHQSGEAVREEDIRRLFEEADRLLPPREE